MNIIPISSGSAIKPFESAFNAPKVGGANDGTFKTMFDDAVTNVEQLNKIKSQDGMALTIGNLDDIGAMQVNSQKAEVALQMLVQMRNKVLEGYQEIMRTGI